MYSVVLFYKYVNIKNPQKVKERQLQICQKLNLKGRTIVAKEGINSTLGGTTTNVKKYIDYMQSIKKYSDIQFKLSKGTKNDFPRLSVKVRDEIVSTHLKGKQAIDPIKDSAPYIKPKQLHKWFKDGKEFYLVDMRNTYEYKVGHFDSSVDSTFDHFRDLPKVTKKISNLKNKVVVTACTGGIRCEKASGYLLKNGFKNVYQLWGGMQTYMQMYPGDDFLGKLYVFDGRITVDFGGKRVVVGKCYKCNNPCETYVNCGYPQCNKHFLCCTNCADTDLNKHFCSEGCKVNLLKVLKEA